MGSNPASGPDMIDCEALMRAIESLHGGKVVLTVFSEGIGGGTGLKVNLVHVVEHLPFGAEELVTGVSSNWPCGSHREFWSCVFDGLYKLDFAIGKSYKQQRLPDA